MTTESESYRSIAPLAVVSLVLGLLSIVIVLWPVFVLVPIAAIVTGMLALRQIRRETKELMGQWAARSGIGLAVLGAVVGYSWATYSHHSQVPHGYQEVTYAELEPNPDKPDELVPPTAAKLDGKRIYVQGYMYPTRQPIHIKQFVISRDNGSCKFCTPNPRPTDLIRVNLVGDLEAEYSRSLVGLGGILHVDEDAAKGIRGSEAAYRLDADYIK